MQPQSRVSWRGWFQKMTGDSSPKALPSKSDSPSQRSSKWPSETSGAGGHVGLATKTHRLVTPAASAPTLPDPMPQSLSNWSPITSITNNDLVKADTWITLLPQKRKGQLLQRLSDEGPLRAAPKFWASACQLYLKQPGKSLPPAFKTVLAKPQCRAEPSAGPPAGTVPRSSVSSPFLEASLLSGPPDPQQAQCLLDPLPPRPTSTCPWGSDRTFLGPRHDAYTTGEFQKKSSPWPVCPR